MRGAVSAFVCFCWAVGLLSTHINRQQTRGKLMRTCRGCGYDLRATPVVCQECGTPIPEELKRAREMGKDKLYMNDGARE